MKQNQAVLETLKQDVAVTATPNLLVEFNHNRYTEPTADNSPSNSVVARDPDLFPISAIVESNRPARGIVKASVDETWVLPENTPIPPLTRYHIAEQEDYYKYWTSIDPSSENSPYSFPAHPDGIYPTNVNPQITYEAPVRANKIVIGLENSTASPSVYNIYVKNTVEGAWVKIADQTNTDIDDQGRIILYRQSNSWSSLRTLDNDTLIAGIQLRVSNMDKGNEYLQLIEIAALLEKDITGYMTGGGVTHDLGDANVVTPIGRISSNVGSVQLFNALVDDDETHGLIFNDQNTFSPFFGLLKENAKFTLSYDYDASNHGGTSKESIPEFTMYAENNWGADLEETVSVSVRDSSKYLQEIDAPETFYEAQEMSVGEIVWRLLDAVGFVDYHIDADDVANTVLMKFFWCGGGDEKVWDVLSTLADGTQTAIYVDSNGILQVKTKDAAFNSHSPVVWDVRGESENTILPDLASDGLTIEDKDIANSVTLKYRPTDYQRTAADNYISNIVWQPEDETVILRSGDLQEDFLVTDDSFMIETTYAADWPFAGMIQVEGELIEYEGKEFVYYTPPDPNAPIEPDASVAFRIASLNINGGYHGDWPARRPVLINHIIAVNPDFLLLQEAHEEAGEHMQILNGLIAAGYTKYGMVLGGGGNHIIMDMEKFEVIGPVDNSAMPHNRATSTMRVRYKPNGVMFGLWNSHFIAGSPPKREEQARYLTNRLSSFVPRIGGGDINNSSHYSGSPLDQFERSGNIETRSSVGSVVNGTLNSHDGYKANPNKGEWIDHIFASAEFTINAVGLRDTGNSSDHNLIWTDAALVAAPTPVVNRNTAWANSFEEYQKLNFMTNVTEQQQNNFTGRIKVKKRGLWNTIPKDHIVAPYPYYVRSHVGNSSYTGIYGYRQKKYPKNSYDTSLTGIKNQKDTILMETSTSIATDQHLLARYGDENGDAPSFVGTRFNIRNTGQKNHMGGLAIATSGAGANGYYLEVRPSKYSTDANREIRLYSKSNGKWINKSGKGVRAAIVQDTWYSIDVQYYNGGTTDYIWVWLNGSYIAKFSVSSNRAVNSDGFGMYVRGSSAFEFEYLYAYERQAEGPYETRWGNDVSYYDRVINGYTANQSLDEFTTGTRSAIRRVKNTNVEYQQRYDQKFFDEFGPIVHQVREFDVKFEGKLPGKGVKLIATENARAKYLDFRGTPFGAHFYAVNVSHDDVEIKGEDVAIAVMAQNIVQQEEEEVTVQDDTSIRINGKKSLEFTSNWIQSKAQATALGEWIKGHWDNRTDELTINVFGNPLLELTDVIMLTDPSSNRIEEKYFVISIRNDWSNGLQTQLRIRRVKETDDQSRFDMVPDIL